MVFANGGEIISAQYVDGVLMLQHTEKTLFSVVSIDKLNQHLQFTQLSLLSIPSLSTHVGPFNYEMFAKKLGSGKIKINVRHLT